MFTLIIEDINGGTTHEHRFDECELIIGRSHEKCDIVLPSDNVSRRHAKLYTSEGRCFVQDLQSANGIYVDGARIRDLAEIQSSNRVRIGDYVLHVELDVQAATGGPLYARLIGGPMSGGAVFEIRQPIYLVGRGKDTSMTVIDASVSRVHSRITVSQNGDIVLQDLRSSNGTFVNDERVEQRLLHHGDRVRFGNIEFGFELPGPRNAAPLVLPTAAPAKMMQNEGIAAAPLLPVSPSGAGAIAGLPMMAPPMMAASDEPDPELVAAQRRRRILLVLLLLIIVGATTTFIILFSRSGDQTPEAGADQAKGSSSSVPGQKTEARDERTKQAEAEEKLREGRHLMAQLKWDSAHDLLREVLQLDPANDEAFKLLDQISQERAISTRMTEADAFVQERKYDKAIKIYEAIPQQSVYRLTADRAIRDLKNKTMTKILEEAGDACNKHEWDLCATRIQEAQMIDPNSPEVQLKLKKLEKKAK